MTLGPLVPDDENFTHQIVDTFATVGQTDKSWTEKVWAMAAARDGSVQLAFAMGKYTNRGVLDACAGISRGTEQWSVRASRELAPHPTSTSVGPIHYEVLEPLRRVRFALEPNDVHPISFEWIFDGAVAPALEDREVRRSMDGYSIASDIVRYHHTGTASGWVDIDGERTEFDESTWVSTRDHSWGARYMVGAPPADLAPQPSRDAVSTLVMWCPVLCERPDGSRYGLHWYYQRHSVGDWQRVEFQGGEEAPDGRRKPFGALVPEVSFRDDNRRFLGGTLNFTTASGEARPITVTPVSDTGFHLGTALYFGFDDRWHGQWKGKLHVEGEYFPDTSDPAVAHRIHQMRDCVVRIDDPVGGGTGWGDLQSIVTGAHPEMGLTAEASFM